MQPFDLIMIVVLILFLLLMPLILVRCVKDLYARKGSTGSGGIIGMMVEMDRIVNPSSEHVTEAKEVETQEDEIGGD